MIHLKYISNPFEEKMMNSMACFSEEKSFYDCINRKFLDSEAFQNLEYTFYAYMLTGDSGEWLGYVLFSNEDRVKQYYQYAHHLILKLLNNIKKNCMYLTNIEEFNQLEKLVIDSYDDYQIRIVLEEALFSLKKIFVSIFLNKFKMEKKYDEYKNKLEQLKNMIEKDNSSIDNITKIDEAFSLLVKLGLEDCCSVNDRILEYQNQLQHYLESFPNYFYLDVVIALPIEEMHTRKDNSKYNINQLAELKYYGFIHEALSVVEMEINHSFQNIPIFLKKENQDIFLINEESSNTDKKIVKRITSII